MNLEQDDEGDITENSDIEQYSITDSLDLYRDRLEYESISDVDELLLQEQLMDDTTYYDDDSVAELAEEISEWEAGIITGFPLSFFLQHTTTAERVQKGASESDLAALKKRMPNDTETTADCTICTEQFQQKELTELPCHHTYHSECILQWLELNASCPICRRSIRDRNNQPDQQREEIRQHDLYPDYENSSYLMGIEDMFNISFESFGGYDSN
ncbi:hypothetical protein G6F70_002172 [Rhizopus microsporus]|uniref:RING-type domain-containing protein n=2 Tax=Rhizopus TaxID=4842 RepID=A0A367JNC6_RHIAZ|nr:hypothetical protein G6F71_006080 [Rhizopus microsporus]RCH91452.1 hypothetical protein CU097_009205 [Rhizopus azygosporus]KAG1202545.1 hypothetical protein G6F70_002172 [Rhizopus microsporus]KAG1210087.1 hypothetical protein G6F69_005778 [Rhizopus microsporus]KAG1231245.1 hypothetical protein G6F67_005904 [Rhizopus microsporus]